MKRCSGCAREYDDEMSFCTDCGTPLAEVPTISDPNARTVRMGSEYETQRMPGKVDDEPILEEMELEFLKMFCAVDQ